MLLRMLRASLRVKRVVTQDIVFLPGEWLNNVLAALDRGRFCRWREQYARPVAGGDLALIDSTIVRRRHGGAQVPGDDVGAAEALSVGT